MSSAPTLDALVDLVTVAWGLEKLCNRHDTPTHIQPQLRYFARKLTALAQQSGAEALDLTGNAYEEGLAVDVLEVSGSRDLPLIISEMVSPIVQVNGRIAKYGQVYLTTAQPVEGSSCDS